MCKIKQPFISLVQVVQATKNMKDHSKIWQKPYFGPFCNEENFGIQKFVLRQNLVI